MIYIYTDGSCYHKDRIGGWGYVIYENPDFPIDSKDIHAPDYTGCDGVTNTTNNQMELRAVIQGLLAVKSVYLQCGNVSHIWVITDSKYVITVAVSDYVQRRGGPADDTTLRDMIAELHGLLAVMPVAFTHVKGHTGVTGNEHADRLAGMERKRLVEQGHGG